MENIFVNFLFDRTDGIGLSAPQVGMNVQLMVFNPAGECGEGEEIVLVNPRVIKYSKKTVPFEEGCLSFPGIYADVEVIINLCLALVILFQWYLLLDTDATFPFCLSILFVSFVI